MRVRPWKTISSQTPYRFLRVDECALPNGRVIEKLIHEYDPWATVIALNTKNDVILIKQYRYAVNRVIWEIPAGVIEPGESPLEGAKRELWEETGYKGGEWIELGQISPNPDNHTNQLNVYLALNVEYSGSRSLDPDEELEVHPTPIKKVFEMARSGQLPQAMQIAALFLASPHLVERGIEI